MNQQQLPYGWKFKEQRAALLRAIAIQGLLRVDRDFLLYVHNVSDRGPLCKTYNELADQLRASRSTVCRAKTRLVDAGLLIAKRQRYRTGHPRDNAYSINWAGVRALTQPTGGECEQSTVHFEQSRCQNEQSTVQNDTVYKEQSLLFSLDCSSSSSPPTPSRSPPTTEVEVVEISWDQIWEQLRAAQVRKIATAVDGARRQGLTPDQVAQMVAEGHDPRALYWRLTEGNWPSGYVPPAKRSSIRLRRTQKARERADRERAADEDAAKDRELEAHFGAELDRLAPEELQRLAERVYTDDFIAYYHRNRDGPEVRRDLLTQLAHEKQEEP